MAAVVLAAAACATAKAGAGLITGNCPTSGTQVFSPWGDSTSYYLAQNGGFENGTTGWTVSGGSVVSDNEPFYKSGSHALSLPSGSTATSPVVCIGASDLYVRMFGKDVGGTDKGLRVQVVWYGLLNTVLGITDFATFTPGGNWAPTGKLSTAGGLAVPLLPILGSTSARIRVTPLGSGSNWRIDDLYVDPWAMRG